MTRADDLGDDRPSVYADDDTGRIIVRASSMNRLASSMCCVVHAALGNQPSPPPPWLRKAFDQGNWGEPEIIERLEKMGWEADGATQDELDWDLPFGVTVRMHPDETGVVKVSGQAVGRYVWEIKALSGRNWQMAKRDGTIFGLPYGYDWQASALSFGFGLPYVSIAADKSACLLPGEDGTAREHFDWTRGALLVHRYDQDMLPIRKQGFVRVAQQVRQTWDQVLAMGMEGVQEMVEAGLASLDCGDDWCPYEHLHASKPAKPAAEPLPSGRLSDDEMADIQALIAEYRSFTEQEGFIRKQKQKVREEIELALGVDKDAPAKVWDVGGWEVGYVTYEKAITQKVGSETASKWRLEWKGAGDPPSLDGPMAGLESLADGDPTDG